MVISLYFHFPFCTKKCPYCHFYVLPNDKERQEELAEGLILEWESKKHLLRPYKIISLYLGGGTPSLLHPKYLKKLLQKLKLKNIEITLEANPENVSPALVKEWKHMGINRISLGIQTFDDALLAFLQRGHNAQKAQHAIHTVYDGGFENITIDLMYELPHQTMESFAQTLRIVKTLPITHLSLYNLSYEPGSVFYKKRESLNKLQPKEATGLQMLKSAIKAFKECGLCRYEISAFAKKGFHSRHNIGYWTDRPFIGFGPSAFSYLEGKRFRNIPHLQKWLASIKQGMSTTDFEEILPPEQHLREKIAIGLRVLKGMTLKQLTPPIMEILKKLETKKLLKIKNSHIKLTPKGLLFYDEVAETII